MAEKKFFLPGVELNVMFHVKHSAECLNKRATFPCSGKDILVVAGGREPEHSWLKTVSANKQVFAADRGAACCLQAGVVPQELFGDCDSTSPAVYEQAQQAGTILHSFNPAKDDTDLQLLLKNLPIGDIIASGIWGGRFDHLYSNVFTLLGIKKKRNCHVLLADDKEFMLLLTAGEIASLQLSAEVEAVSLLPLAGDAVVDFKGVRWELEKAKLRQLYPYAISNVPLNEHTQLVCSCYSGALGLYIRWLDKNKI